ncbi:uncharacterized protein [Musca autumnalis]|uniref:uncharacterized protein n=1 Tax=Musca autumnalis TaxID=221902 RepID=UPI003CFA9030
MDSSSDIFPFVTMPENEEEMMSDGEVAKEILLSKIDEAVASSDKAAPVPPVAEDAALPRSTTSSAQRKIVSASTTQQRSPCRLCSLPHQLYQCVRFKRMQHHKRLRFVISNGYCRNCLKPNHNSSACPVDQLCHICREPHHSLLHSRTRVPNNSASRRQRAGSNNRSIPSSTAVRPVVEPNVTRTIPPLPISRVVTLAPTAVVRLCFKNGSMHVRALIDPCAGVSRICETLVSHLKWPVSSVDGARYCDIMITSCHDPTQRQYLTAQVARLSYGRTPALSIPPSIGDSFIGLQLADPEFFKSRAVAMVLGPEIYSKIIIPSRVMAQPGLPTAQYTSFGWVISGAVHP